jgi:hypothetical protein
MAAAMVGLWAGCGGEDRVEVYPAAGTVTYRGRPADGAEVTLYWAGESVPDRRFPIPSGTVGGDGRYELTSFEPADGAPPGLYLATVVWLEAIKPGENPEAAARGDRLGGRYANPETSGLSVTIEPRENALPPFDLQ